MENKVKGTEYDDRNIHRDRRDYRNNSQYHCYDNQYPTDLQETETSEVWPYLLILAIAG